MTKKKYINYTVEELIHDQEFVEKVKSIQSEKEWLKFLKDNKESKEKILQARNIISMFKVDDGKLEAKTKHELWLSISNFNKSFKQTRNVIQFRNIVKIAASVLVVIAVGSLLYLNSIKNENSYTFSELKNTIDPKNPVLILANGEKIEVQEDNSEITILENQDAVQINSDTIYRNNSVNASYEKEIHLNELVIPFGKKSMVVLCDGTKVWLNAGSRFAFPQKFTGKNRTVFLDGEGYFEVTENKKLPFIVSSRNINIEVLGTKFNVSTYSSDDFCEAVLLKGSINIWSKNRFLKDKTRMFPNQRVTYDIVKKEMVVKPEPEVEDYIAWVKGWYKFSNENLEQVLNKLERYYNVKFQYNKKSVKDVLPISGKLDLKESFDDVMRAFAKVAEIDYKIEGENIIINN
jgi:hypothetical protein